MSWQLNLAYRTQWSAHQARRRLGNQDPASILEELAPVRPEAPPPASVHSVADVVPLNVAGRPVLRVTPKTGTSWVHVIYVHGGGYIWPMSWLHWNAIRFMATHGATVWVPSYQLAPEHTYDDSLTLFEDLYSLVLRASAGAHVVLAGDSAGGGLALALAIRARDSGWEPVRRLALYSPWVDVTMSNPAARELEGQETLVQVDQAIVIGGAWAGSRSTQDPMVSPLFDSLKDLPPLRIYQGEHEVFTPQVRDFTAKARAAGTSVYLDVLDGAFHVYPLHTLIPEANAALAHSIADL